MSQSELNDAMSHMSSAITKLETLQAEPIGERVASLRSSWTTLVRVMDVAPPAKTRVCPGCGHSGLTIATRCGFCWIKLQPQA